MATEMETLLAQTPEHMRKGLEDLLDSTRKQRLHYGFEVPEGTIPLPLTLEEMKAGEMANAKRLTEQTIAEHAGKRDLDDWLSVWLSRATHDRDLPGFAFETVVANCWTPSEARALTEAAWTLPEWPGQWPKWAWLRIFNEVGFICTVAEDGGTCPWHPAQDTPGEETVQVWRGALTSQRRGMAWTTDRDRALWFVSRGDMIGKGRPVHLWTASATPERVLGHFNRRNEEEFVLDTARLIIRQEPI